MIIKDKGDVWGWCLDNETVYYEDGTSAPLSSKLVEQDFGKYKGTCLEDIDDVGYLQWLKKQAVENEDVFAEKCVRVRLEELV